MRQWGVKYPGSKVMVHNTEETAVAAVDRAQRLPVTKGAYLLMRRAPDLTWERR